MKKRLFAGIAVLAVTMATLVGCSATASQAASSAKPYGDCAVSGTKGQFKLHTITPGELVVKADLPSPGWYNGDTVDDIKSGVDYCVLANIAYRAGISKIVLQNASFDGLIAGKAGGMDLTLNQITITPAREKVFDFSVPYFSSNSSVVVKAGTTLTRADLKNAQLGVKQGTVEQILTQDKIHPTKQPSVFPGDTELDSAVRTGQVQAGIQDLGIALAAAHDSHGAIKVIAQIDSGQHYGVMLPKGSPNTKVVNQIIEQMLKDGTIDRIAAKYLGKAYGTDPTKIPVWKLR